MAQPLIDPASGRLTEYGLACGYIETRSTDRTAYRQSDLYTELYQEGPAFHVRQFDRRSGVCRRVFWTSFAGLGAARCLFDRQPGE